MKNSIRFFSFAFIVVLLASCANREDFNLDQGLEVPNAVIQKFKDLGFNVDGLKMDGPNYLVEGDIIVTPLALSKMSDPVSVPGVHGEQYHTFNLVDPGTITIGAGRRISSQLDAAIGFVISNYNSLNLDIEFVRNDNNPDITVNEPGGRPGGVAGFPPGNGSPYDEANVFKTTKRYGQDVVNHVLTHEVGHCIGLRHSDWFDRSYSCGSGGSEGQQNTGVGAVHINGTPTGVSAGSVMNSCFNSNSDGQWNSDDVTALTTIY